MEEYILILKKACILMEVRINWSYPRAQHAIERSILRGITQAEFKEAIVKGAKKRVGKKMIESRYRFFSVVYEERYYKRGATRKIFPITVKVE